MKRFVLSRAISLTFARSYGDRGLRVFSTTFDSVGLCPEFTTEGLDVMAWLLGTFAVLFF